MEEKEWYESLSKERWRDWVTSPPSELFFDNLAKRLEDVSLAFYSRIAASSDRDTLWATRCEMMGRTNELKQIIAEAKTLGGFDED